MSSGTVYNPASDIYEAQLVPAMFSHWARRLVDSANLRPGDRVLDLACGTGIVARTAAPRLGPAGTVTAVDINPAMLEVAGECASEAGVAVRFDQADASEGLPFDDDQFDVVLCQQGLQFFSDRVAALAEVRRVTAPRGRAIFTVWRERTQQPAFEILDQVVRTVFGEETMAGSDAPFALGDREVLRSDALAAGFDDVHLGSQAGHARFISAGQMLAAVGGAHAPIAAALADLDSKGHEELVQTLGERLAPYTDDDGVLFAMVTSVLTAA